MNDALVPIVISSAITILGVLVAYFQWRKDVQVKLEEFREEVTVELVRERVKVYSDFVMELEPMSTLHRDNIEDNPERKREFLSVFQKAIYSPVGLLASQSTRELLMYARLGCQQYLEKNINYDEWRKRVWAVSLGIRSDLGIAQSFWPSEVDRIRTKAIEEGAKHAQEQVESLDALVRYDHDSKTVAK